MTIKLGKVLNVALLLSGVMVMGLNLGAADAPADSDLKRRNLNLVKRAQSLEQAMAALVDRLADRPSRRADYDKAKQALDDLRRMGSVEALESFNRSLKDSDKASMLRDGERALKILTELYLTLQDDQKEKQFKQETRLEQLVQDIKKIAEEQKEIADTMKAIEDKSYGELKDLHQALSQAGEQAQLMEDKRQSHFELIQALKELKENMLQASPDNLGSQPREWKERLQALQPEAPSLAPAFNEVSRLEQLNEQLGQTESQTSPNQSQSSPSEGSKNGQQGATSQNQESGQSSSMSAENRQALQQQLDRALGKLNDALDEEQRRAEREMNQAQRQMDQLLAQAQDEAEALQNNAASSEEQKKIASKAAVTLSELSQQLKSQPGPAPGEAGRYQPGVESKILQSLDDLKKDLDEARQPYGAEDQKRVARLNRRQEEITLKGQELKRELEKLPGSTPEMANDMLIDAVDNMRVIENEMSSGKIDSGLWRQQRQVAEQLFEIVDFLRFEINRYSMEQQKTIMPHLQHDLIEIRTHIESMQSQVSLLKKRQRDDGSFPLLVQKGPLKTLDGQRQTWDELSGALVGYVKSAKMPAFDMAVDNYHNVQIKASEQLSKYQLDDSTDSLLDLAIERVDVMLKALDLLEGDLGDELGSLRLMGRESQDSSSSEQDPPPVSVKDNLRVLRLMQEQLVYDLDEWQADSKRSSAADRQRLEIIMEEQRKLIEQGYVARGHYKAERQE